jgi:hypothetical protein
MGAFETHDFLTAVAPGGAGLLIRRGRRDQDAPARDPGIGPAAVTARAVGRSGASEDRRRERWSVCPARQSFP